MILLYIRLLYNRSVVYITESFIRRLPYSIYVSLPNLSVHLLSVPGIDVRQHAQLQPTPARRVSLLLPQVVSRLRRVGQLPAGKRQSCLPENWWVNAE